MMKLQLGLLRSILKQAKVSSDEFIKFVK